MTGLFVTFEGGEGSGKSTQIARLADSLKADGRQVVVTREPGGTTGADILREVVLAGGAKRFGNDAEAALFAAARADHMECVILPALAAGHDVLCDRFVDSTRVYQGRPDNAAYLAALERAALAGRMPDLTFILDVPAEVGLKRAAGRRGTGGADRFEAEEASLHEARRLAFLTIAAQEPERCIIVDATGPVDEIAQTILDHVRVRAAAEA